MKTYHPILKLLLPFVLGVIIAHYFSKSTVNTQFISFLFLFFILSTVLFSFIFRELRNVLAIGLYISFFSLGFNLHIESKAPNKNNYFGNVVGSYYKGKIQEVKESGRYYKCLTEVEYVLNDWGKERVFGQINVYIDTSTKDVSPNYELIFPADIIPISNKNNPGEFDGKQYWNNKQIYYQVFCENNQFHVIPTHSSTFNPFTWLNKQIHSILETHLSGDVLSIAKGILLGDKSEIRMELKDAFSGAGAMHLLAVSGLHVGIFLVIIQWLFSIVFSRLPKWVELVLILVILWTYAGITGFSPSVNRAVTMFSFVAYGSILGKHYQSMNGLLASALLLLIINPFNLFDIGFQLSYLAMLGIFTFSAPIEKSWKFQHKLLSKIWTGTSVALAAQIGTFPLTLYYFHQFPNYFLLTNLGLMVLSGLLLSVGLGVISFGTIPYLGLLFGLLLTGIVTVLIMFIEWVNQLPFAMTKGFQLTIIELIGLYTVIILVYWGLISVRKKVIYISIMLGLILVSHQSFKWHNKYTLPEVIVLNQSSPMLLIRNGKQGKLLTFSRQKNITEKTRFQLHSLENFYGIEIEHVIVDYPKGKIEIDYPKITISHSANHINFNYGQEICYVFGNQFDKSELHTKDMIIVGNWITEINYQSLLEEFGKEKVYAIKQHGALKLH